MLRNAGGGAMAARARAGCGVCALRRAAVSGRVAAARLAGVLAAVRCWLAALPDLLLLNTIELAAVAGWATDCWRVNWQLSLLLLAAKLLLLAAAAGCCIGWLLQHGSCWLVDRLLAGWCWLFATVGCYCC